MLRGKSLLIMVWLTLGACVFGQAATILVRNDQAMLAAANLVVDATVASVQPVLHENGRVYTHVRLVAHEAWKGDPHGAEITVIEPGGAVDGVLDWVPGVPRYTPGTRVVAFLVPRRGGTWRTLDLWAGLFHMRETVDGRAVLLRGQVEEGLLLYGPRFRPFRDTPRDFSAFREWIRARTEGVSTDLQYHISREELREAGGLVAEDAEPPMQAKWGLLGAGNMRWHEYDTGGAVSWYYGNDPQVGFTAGQTSGDGPDEFDRALTTWTNAPSSAIRLTNAGRHSPYGAGWDGGADGYSEVLFNDPYNEISGDFSCSGGGVLGFGGVHSISGSHSFRGQSWFSAAEGDVVMQSWPGDCSWLDSEDLTEILQHELGHALGFGHSYDNGESHDQLTDDAVMRWFAHGGSLADLLGEDDRCVAYWLYPAARVDTELSPNSTVSVSPSTLAPNGSATVTVSLASASGPAVGQIVRGWIETVSGTATGSLDRGNPYPDQPFTDQGNGDYTATLSTGSDEGQLVVHIRVDCCDDAVPAPPQPCDAFSPTATVTVLSGPIPGDADGSGAVTGADLAMTAAEIFDMDGTATNNRCGDGPCPEPEVDGNSDGTIDAADLAVEIQNGS